jgi:hypothetical protein
MNRRELEQTRDRVEEQLRWAQVHDGDQELLDLLRIESERLSLKITAMSRCPDQLMVRFGHATGGFSSIMRIPRTASPPLRRE